MKAAFMIVVALAIALVSGCVSPQGGSMASDEGFRITAPALTTDIKQGDRQTVTVSVLRGKYFKQDVTLQATAPKGISVEPSKAKVEASASPDVQFQVRVDRNAPLGNYNVRVVATPATGAPTSMSFAVEVVAP